VLLMSVFQHMTMVHIEDSALLNLFQLMLLHKYLFVILVFGHFKIIFDVLQFCILLKK
jgi:hypothetical protein